MFDDANPLLDVNLEDVNKIHIGFGTRGEATTKGGKGRVYFDDIILYGPRCVPSLLHMTEDLDEDCDVDNGDLEVMANNWLEKDYYETGKLLLRWNFEESSGTTVHDTSGNNRHGEANEPDLWYAPGQIGSRCMYFSGDGDNVTDNDANLYMDRLHGLSVCLWVRSDVNGTDKGFIVFDSNNYTASGDYKNMRYDLSGYYSGRTNIITCGVNTTKGRQSVESSAWSQKETQWQHVAMTWAVGEPVCLYIDGVRDPGASTNDPRALGATTGYNAVTVGKGKEDGGPKAKKGWDGLIDDVQIYNHKLTAADIATVRAGGTIADRPNIYYPLLLPGELYTTGEALGSRKINFKDYAVLVSNNWLKEALWP